MKRKGKRNNLTRKQNFREPVVETVYHRPISTNLQTYLQTYLQIV